MKSTTTEAAYHVYDHIGKLINNNVRALVIPQSKTDQIRTILETTPNAYGLTLAKGIGVRPGHLSPESHDAIASILDDNTPVHAVWQYARQWKNIHFSFNDVEPTLAEKEQLHNMTAITINIM